MSINPDIAVKLRRSLTAHEEYRKFPYIDTSGKTTIGIGYNLTDRGISDDWINTQYNDDVNFFFEKLSSLPWFVKLNTDRKIVLLDMAYNLGWRRFLEFHHMIDALAKEDYVAAACEMIKSEWAHQVKNRADSLANAMLSGVYDI